MSKEFTNVKCDEFSIISVAWSTFVTCLGVGHVHLHVGKVIDDGMKIASLNSSNHLHHSLGIDFAIPSM